MKLVVMRMVMSIVLIFILGISWLSLSSSGLQWGYQLASNYLPEGLQVDSIEGRLIGPLVLENVRYHQQNGGFIQTEQVTLDWNPAALLLAQLNIQSLQIESLFIQIPVESPGKTSTEEKIRLPDFNLPLQIRMPEVVINQIKINQGQDSYQLTKLELSAATILNHLTLRSLTLKNDYAGINVSGDVQLSGAYRHKLKTNWWLKQAGYPELQGQGSLVGEVKSSLLKQKVSGSFELALEVQVNDLLDRLNWKANVNLQRFDSAQINPQWPDFIGQLQFKANGDLQQVQAKGAVKGFNSDLGQFDSKFDLNRAVDQQININQLTFSAESTKSDLQATGYWKPDLSGKSTNHYGFVKLDLNWQHLKWPQQGNPWFDSPSGKAILSGNPDKYRFVLDSDRPWSQLPASHWKISGQGNLQGLALDDFTIETLDGKMAGTARINWNSGVNWNADIKANDINPAQQWPDWPGRLTGKFNHSGSYQQQKLSLKTEIVQLTGVIREYPLLLSGLTEWKNDKLNVKRLNLQSGLSTVTLDGQYGEQLLVNWSVDSPNLAELYPATRGKLKASGTVSGTVEQPLIQTRFSGAKLAWQQLEIGDFKGSSKINPYQWQQADVSLDVNNALVQGLPVKSARFSRQGNTILLDVVSDKVSTSIKLTGSINDKRWQGVLEKADINSPVMTNWSLLAPVNLLFENNVFKSDRLCWGNAQQAQICSRVKFADNQYLSDVELKKISLALLKPWLAQDVRPSGLVNGNADLKFSALHKLSGKIRLESSEGTIHYLLPESDKELWPYQHAQIDININAKGMFLKSTLAINQNDFLSVDVDLAGADLFLLNRQQKIKALAKVNINDLELLGGLIPEVRDASGEVKLSLVVKGSIEKPELQGFANLDNGSFRIPRLGLDIKQLTLAAITDAQQQLNFELSALSGEGNIQLKGHAGLDKLNHWSTEFNVTGTNFEVSKIPEARVQVSPKLTVSIQPQQINISGDLHVPYARLSPKDISTAVQVSDDVVILGEENVRQEKWKITSRVRLTLDEQYVRFLGFGFEGNLGGSLLLEDKPGQLTTARGEIKVPEGKYRAYGQRLDIQNGRILFTGGPLTNPGLDFRATRQVNDVTAGIKVSGPLIKPKLELFSIPAMGQTDALSYLVLGRPMETSSSEDGQLIAKAALAIGLSGGDNLARMIGDRFGLDEMRVESSETGDQASLVVGRYLSPKLYVSYGVGLIESINTISIRYQISSKWQLKAESGEADGADLLYTLER